MAAELERRWNERLAETSRREAESEVLQALTGPALLPGQQVDPMAMGADLRLAWSHPGAGNEVR